MTVLDYFENVTIAYRTDDSQFKNISIIVNLIGMPSKVSNPDLIKLKSTDSQKYQFIWNPIESVSNAGIGHKWFTFFSQLQEQWRNFQMILDMIELEIYHDD